MITSATESLVIDVRRQARPFARREIVAVVIGDVGGAASGSQALELRNKSPAGIVISEENRIARGSRSGREQERFGFPVWLRRRRTIVKGGPVKLRGKSAEEHHSSSIRN